MANKIYPKKEKKAFIPRFLSDGTYNPAKVELDSKHKVNPSNFMKLEEYQKSEYYGMSKSDYEDMRARDAYKSISF